MINKSDDQLSTGLDTASFNEQVSNSGSFDVPVEFEVSHSAPIIEKLIHLSRFGNLLTLLVGNNGSGKTRLIGKFLSALEDNRQICHIKAHPLLSIDQIFQQVIESFSGDNTYTGIPLTAKQYEDWAEQLSAVPGNRLLIMDDAEVLSTSVLHELCKLSAMQQAKETPHLHIILVGNYDLYDILEQASQGVLDEDGIYTLYIPFLSDDEASDWLNYLFADAGVAFLPDQDEVEEMLTKGQGNLVFLKELAKEFGTLDHDIKAIEIEPESWKISLVGYWFAGLTVLLLVVLGLFFFQKEIAQLMGFNDSKETVVQVRQNAIDISTIESPPTNDNIDQALSVVTEIILDNEQEPIDPIAVFSAAPEVEIKEIIEIEQSVLTFPSEEAELKEEPILSADEQKLLNAADSSYVLQLVGLRKESSVLSFIARHNNPNLLYYQRTLNGEPWFVVVLGFFENRADAITARNQLSTELKKLGPWAKPIQMIKSDILQQQQTVGSM